MEATAHPSLKASSGTSKAKNGLAPMFDASRIFSRRKPQKKTLGDLNANLKELSIRQVVKSLDEVAEGSSFDEMEDLAQEIAFWPSGVQTWLLPRLDWRIVLA